MMGCFVRFFAVSPLLVCLMSPSCLFSAYSIWVFGFCLRDLSRLRPGQSLFFRLFLSIMFFFSPRISKSGFVNESDLLLLGT